jgi:EAL domain-containing protein (putative c-di-GMP-specific phosphodiesterase class I)
VSGLPADSGDGAIIGAVTAMARAFRLPVVAEGVETVAQCQALQKLGCDYAQGYLFGSPVPADEFVRLLHGRNHARVGLRPCGNAVAPDAALFIES